MAGGAQRQKIMTGLAFVLGIVTAFQASALQIYFLVSGVLGAGTGYLLRQNWFRRAIRIRTLPSKESTEMYTQVIKGNLKLKDIKGKDGKVRYQAPTAPTKPTRRTAATLSGLNIKTGTQLPLHLQVDTKAQPIDRRRPDREEDFEEGARGSVMEKLDYYRRNYRVAFVWRRLKAGMAGMARRNGFGGKEISEAQRRRKDAAERYESERKRRLGAK
jgi:YidC/Oxa1 family membrane protein insertase